jgi:hypothetical protein
VAFAAQMIILPVRSKKKLTSLAVNIINMEYDNIIRRKMFGFATVVR